MFELRPRPAAFAALLALALAPGLPAAARAALPDSTAFAPYLTFKAGTQTPCTSDTVWLVADDLCPSRLGFVSFQATDPTHAVLSLAALAQTTPCVPAEYPLAMGPEPVQDGNLSVEVRVHVPADSASAAGDVVFHELAFYDVPDTCTAKTVAGPFVQQVVVGAPPCTGCAPVVCPDQAYPVTVSGYLPGTCWQFEGLALTAPVGGVAQPPAVIVRERNTARVCGEVMVPFSATITLPGLPPGDYQLAVVEQRRNVTDSSVVVVPAARPEFGVPDSCPAIVVPPPPVEPSIDRVAFGTAACDSCRPVVCANAAMKVTVSGTLPNACWQFLGLLLPPTASAVTQPIVIATFRAPCSNVACAGPTVSFSDTVDAPSGAAGLHVLSVLPIVRGCPDSSSATPLTPVLRDYAAVDSCGAPPVAARCVDPFLAPVRATTDSASACDAIVAPGGKTSLTFTARADGVPLAGLQGGFVASPHLHIVKAIPVGVAAGMHLVTQAHGDSTLSFVLFADHGAPIPAGVPAPVLWVEVTADSALGGATQAHLAGAVTAGADSLGSTVPVCPIATLRVVAATVCFAPPAGCDVNGDGTTNVADLVAMARCWFRPETCPDTLAARPDCDGDGAFTVDDILCCARAILGGGGPDSTAHPAGSLRVVLGPAQGTGGTVEVPLELTGAEGMGGALLHVRYPADRYTALAVGPGGTTPTGSGPWLPLVQVEDGDVVVGVLRLDTTAPGEVSVPLYFALKPGAVAGGEVTVDEGSVTGTDGTALAVDLSGTSAPLAGEGAGGITQVELAAGPNPASGTTRLVARLPRAGSVDLSVYDLAGRRVATLAHGALGAGEHAYTWGGGRSGVYFARLRVDGIVRTTRVVLELAR